MRRSALIVALFVVYVGALRLTGQAPGGVGAQGTRSAARDWTQDMAMKITEPFTLASVGDVIIVRPASQFDRSRPAERDQGDPRRRCRLRQLRVADPRRANIRRPARRQHGRHEGSGRRSQGDGLHADEPRRQPPDGRRARKGIVRDDAADGRGRTRLRGRRTQSRRGARAAVRRDTEGPHRPRRDVQRDRRRPVAAGGDLPRRRHRWTPGTQRAEPDARDHGQRRIIWRCSSA